MWVLLEYYMGQNKESTKTLFFLYGNNIVPPSWLTCTVSPGVAMVVTLCI